MRSRLIILMLTLTCVSALVACQSASTPHSGTSAQNADARLSPVETPENCPSDDSGFGANVRHFGDTTPWSENPYLNPCWPN
jgi:hypothetical protein